MNKMNVKLSAFGNDAKNSIELNGEQLNGVTALCVEASAGKMTRVTLDIDTSVELELSVEDEFTRFVKPAPTYCQWAAQLTR